MKRLLDTNAVLYFLGGRVAEDLAEGEYFVSVITEIELLSYPSLDTDAEQKIRSFLLVRSLNRRSYTGGYRRGRSAAPSARSQAA